MKKYQEYIEKIDRPLVNVLSSMEELGIKVNKDYLKELSKQFNIDALNIEKKIYKITE